MDEPSQAELRKKENPLRIGVSTLDELEEKIKAFRIMNQSALKKRFIMSREDVRVPTNRDPLLTKGEEIDISRAKLLRRHFGGEQEFKCFQPDEGIVIVSDMNEMAGISLYGHSDSDDEPGRRRLRRLHRSRRFFFRVS